MFQLLPFAEGFLQDAGNRSCARKETHQVVLEGNEKLGGARIPLAGTTSPKLAIDTAGLVSFRANDIQPAERVHPFAEFDIRPASGHIGGDGDGALLPGACHNVGLLRVEFRIENTVDNVGALEHPTEHLGGLHRGGAHEDGLP